MMTEIKEIIGNPVISSIFTTIIGVLTKKYIQFHRRDLFSRSVSEQIKAVKWFREATALTPDPLVKAEQQLRLQSFGLLRDFHLSYKIICFQSVHPQSLISSLKTVLRYQGMYTVTDGNIHPHEFHRWLLPIALIIILFYFSVAIGTGLLHGDIIQILVSLFFFAISFITWSWVTICARKVSSISKKLNAYVPPSRDCKSSSGDFSAILNGKYP